MKKDMYYSGHELMSRNKALSIVISGRGSGKTYYFKKLAVKTFIKSFERSKSQNKGKVIEKDLKTFVYLRRYKTELKGTNVASFFDDFKHEFPNYKLLVKGSNFYLEDKGTLYKMGCCFALTQQVQMKSTVINNGNTAITIFDEAIIDNRRSLKYLKDEGLILLDVYSTITRSRDNVRHFVLGNNIRLSDFYLLDFFKIKVNPERIGQQRFFHSKENSEVVLEIYENKQEFTENMLSTSFGRLISSVKNYGDYAIHNKILYSNNTFVISKTPKNAIHKCTLKMDNELISMWISDTDEVIWFSTTKHDPYNKRRFAITNEDKDLDYQSLNKFRSSSISSMLKMYYDENAVYYESENVQEKVMRIMQMIGIR